MRKLVENYKLSIFETIAELHADKIYIVKSSFDNKIYIKKILPVDNYEIYKEIKGLNIPNIPKIYEIINMEDRLIIIEEYINGYSLQEILERSGALPENTVIKYMLDLVDILEKLQYSKLHIIHRDINPSNIMISNDDILKLIDFDISRKYKANKSTDTNILGTYGYAAPEQFGFNQSDIRTDIYSIGATMNVLLTEKLPKNKLYKGSLSQIISKCLELDPKKRFQTFEALKKALIRKHRKYQTRNNQYIDLNLPGFKSDILIFKIIGSLWYILLGLILLGFFDDEIMSENRISNILLALLLLSLTFLYGNYQNIKGRLPLLRSTNFFIKLLGYILYTIVLIIVFGILLPN